MSDKTDPLVFECKHCERQERRSPVPLGTVDDSARVAGWRIGVYRDDRIGVGPGGCGEDVRVEICPECAGTDEGYWDRRTMSVAYQAGIDAGNTAWGAG